MPATRIVILEKTGPAQYSYILWADVPVTRQAFYADTNKTSAWLGASQSDISALRAGSIVEEQGVISRSPGDSLANVQAELVDLWTAFQARTTNTNPWVRYGSVYNDQGQWVAGGVA